LQNKESAIQSSVPQRRFHGIDRLEWLDKALVLASSRLDKSIRFIKSYRVGFADDVRRQTDRLLMADVTPRQSAA
jgi:hypothetical protein